MLIFETHATSLDNEARLASGWYDVDLSPTGERQARELGERRSNFQVDAVFCSDLLRAKRTAEIAFGPRGVRIVVDARLRECDYGDLTRAPADVVEERRLRCIDAPFPNGESYEQSIARVREWLADTRLAQHEHPIVVIGHRATFYAFEHLLKGRPLHDVLAAPWQWQPGWEYPLTPSD
jgi:2,3-bisphosphoglycerate-dependent phosphoglycerate mutase